METLILMSYGFDFMRYGTSYLKKVLQGVAETKPLSLRLRELQSLAKKLDSLALLSTFLASVQAITLQMAIEKNDSHVEKATNGLAFAGLLADVLGAAGCLSVSATVQKASILLEDLIDVELSLKDAMSRLDQDQDQDQPGGGYTKGDIEDIEDRQDRLVKALRDPLFQTIKARSDAFGTTITLGSVCLTSSVFCLCLATQPAPIWITAIVIVSVVGLLSPFNILMEVLFGIGSPGLIDMDEDPLRNIRANTTVHRKTFVKLDSR